MLQNRTDRGIETALAILPILVQRVLAGGEITIPYGDLADELALPPLALSYPPVKLGYPLGCLEEILLEVSERWEEEIPEIQGLVVNKSTNLPGDNVRFFRDQGMTLLQKRALFADKLEEIRNYRKWLDVLAELRLSLPES